MTIPTPYLIRRTDDRLDRYLWTRIGNAFGWCSEERYALCFPTREAAEFALLGLDGCEVVEHVGTPSCGWLHRDGASAPTALETPLVPAQGHCGGRAGDE